MILFVCTTGPVVGLGHLTRMLSVSEALKKEGINDMKFLVFGESVKRIELEKTESVFVSDDSDFPAEVKREIKTRKPDMVIFDIHQKFINKKTPGLLTELSKQNISLIGVDCLFSFVNILDLIWIPSFHMPEQFSHIVPEKVINGWDTYLIQKRLTTPEWANGNKVLVLTGGSDLSGLSEKMPQIIDNQLPEVSEINWVQGPFASPPVLPKNPRLKWLVHSNIESLDNLIVQSNFALTVFGVSFFELLQYGIPTVVFSPYNGKDDRELSALEIEEVAIVANNYKEAVKDLGILMHNEKKSKSFSEKARSKFSINGAQNLASNILSLLRNL